MSRMTGRFWPECIQASKANKHVVNAKQTTASTGPAGNFRVGTVQQFCAEKHAVTATRSTSKRPQAEKQFTRCNTPSHCVELKQKVRFPTQAGTGAYWKRLLARPPATRGSGHGRQQPCAHALLPPPCPASDTISAAGRQSFPFSQLAPSASAAAPLPTRGMQQLPYQGQSHCRAPPLTPPLLHCCPPPPPGLARCSPCRRHRPRRPRCCCHCLPCC